MSEKRLLAKYQKEREALVAEQTTRAARLTALDDVIRSLQVMLGEVPARRGGTAKATGTQALILDVLADGTRRSLREIAAAVQAKPQAVAKHLRRLVVAGDVEQRGKSRATTYGVP
jgi:hypothetical protein